MNLTFSLRNGFWPQRNPGLVKTRQNARCGDAPCIHFKRRAPVEKVTIANDVSETLFINIAMKAYEHERANGILKDQFSLEL